VADELVSMIQPGGVGAHPKPIALEPGRGQHRKYLPYGFTEHGAIMAATVLKRNSACAGGGQGVLFEHGRRP
jgi:hypothetical protein